jgi:hypothetical protein
MSLPSRLLGANPSIQVSTLLSGSLSTPSAKGVFVPQGDYESIATVLVGSGGSSSVTFTSIPQTYAHLQLRYISRDARTGSVDSPVDLTFNGSSSSYSKQFLQGAGSTVSAGAETGSTYLRLEGGGNQSLSDSFGAGVADILDYTSTSKNKTVYQIAGVDKNGSGFVRILGGSWYISPVAITSITLTPFSSPFAQYSHFALYGIKGA